MRLPSFSRALVMAMVLVALPGCAIVSPLGLANWNPFDKLGKYQKADAKHPVNDMLAIWQEAEGPGLNGIPTRGFSGQVFFFSQNSTQPVLVDGKIRIYLFDDRGTIEEQGKPIHIFEYEPSAWAAHMYPSNMGPSYAVFIPYTRDDFHQAHCALRIRFAPAVGSPVFSPMATVLLNGPPLPDERNAENATTSSPGRKDGSKLAIARVLARSQRALAAAPTATDSKASLAAGNAPNLLRNGDNRARPVGETANNSRQVILAHATQEDAGDGDEQTPLTVNPPRERSTAISASSTPIKLQPVNSEIDEGTPTELAQPSISSDENELMKRHPLAD